MPVPVFVCLLLMTALFSNACEEAGQMKHLQLAVNEAVLLIALSPQRC